MIEVTIYTDGACSGNPGPGGWGVVLLHKGVRKELSGREEMTTNQRMELTAAVKGLSALKYPCRVTLYSDSAYLINAFQKGWLENWEKNGWKTAKKTDVENQDLWRELLKLSRLHKVKWMKVKGHSDITENQRCDQLAREAIKKDD